MTRVAIIGTVGIPASYGGFETLAENLVGHAQTLPAAPEITVYCAAAAYPERPATYRGARLRYIPLPANGGISLLYDMWSILDAVLRKSDVVLLLGHGGAFILPVLKPFTRTRFITNIDGIEWRRAKWGRLARMVLRRSEAMAIRHSHVVIADNDAIGDYVQQEFDRPSVVIPYGGDHALATPAAPQAVPDLPERYALALCRIEPENNIAMILEAWSELAGDADALPLVFVGNWNKSDHGRALRARYGNRPGLHLLDPVYAPGALRAIRDRATIYLHGHSAGGTNPALVEMMHFAIPVLAHGCDYNRRSTEGRALYFETAAELVAAVRALQPGQASEIGAAMAEIARRRYTWAAVGQEYFDLIRPPVA